MMSLSYPSEHHVKYITLIKILQVNYLTNISSFFLTFRKSNLWRILLWFVVLFHFDEQFDKATSLNNTHRRDIQDISICTEDYFEYLYLAVTQFEVIIETKMANVNCIYKTWSIYEYAFDYSFNIVNIAWNRRIRTRIWLHKYCFICCQNNFQIIEINN